MRAPRLDFVIWTPPKAMAKAKGGHKALGKGLDGDDAGQVRGAQEAPRVRPTLCHATPAIAIDGLKTRPREGCALCPLAARGIGERDRWVWW